MEMIEEIKLMKPRQILYQTLQFALVICSALMIWKSLMIVTNCESPIVVVLTGSMRPAFWPGDLLFLWNHEEDIRVGDVVVYKLEGKEIPIVHRVLKVHDRGNGDFSVLTKGDNNTVDDIGLYPHGKLWLNKNDIIGKAKGCLPFIGYVTIIMTDYPMLKYALIGMMGLFMLTSKEQS